MRSCKKYQYEGYYYCKLVDNLPEHKKYDVHALLEKARELIKQKLAKNTVGAQKT